MKKKLRTPHRRMQLLYNYVLDADNTLRLNGKDPAQSEYEHRQLSVALHILHQAMHIRIALAVIALTTTACAVLLALQAIK